jgi:hypothetical protein
MRSGLSALLLACLTIACSASENANHSIRCDSNTLCPSQQVCYREFCIPDDALPRFDLDASDVVAEPAVHDAGRRDGTEVVVPLDPLDASTTDDAALSTAEDAQSGPVVPTTPAGEPMTTPVVPPATTPPATTPPAPDAGSPASDAGHINSSALLICVPSCANRSSGCWFCLNGVLATNPGICSKASRADPVSSGLCDFLCATAACRGEP